jgi:Immunoglobulin domain
MKRRIPHIVSLAAISGLLAIIPNITRAQTTDPLLADPADQAQFPVITAQPLDQVVPAGSNVVLSVQAAYADNYQWQSNGVDIVGQTNSTLALQNLGPNGAGLYSCNVSQIGGDPVPTRAASVEVETTANATAAGVTANGVTANGILGGGPITVSGTPKTSNGAQGTCPGSYAGYVIYSKTISQGWGWTPVSGATPLTASDGGGRTDTFVTYAGMYGDSGCGQTTVTIPYPPPSPAYRFAIYFPNNVPTTNYPLVLTNFNQ